MKLLRMKPGHGEIVLAEGDVEVAAEEQALIEAFRRQLDAGMWAAVPTLTTDGRREAELVKSFDEVPRDAECVIFFPRAAGGAHGRPSPYTPAPGMAPPDSMPPGIAPPDSVAPGVAPTGIAPPDSVAPGMAPAGMAPRAVARPAIMPSACALPATPPPGTAL